MESLSLSDEVSKEVCMDYVLPIFHDVCPRFLDELAEQHAFDPNAVISAILDRPEGYPKRENSKKRKRDDEDPEVKDDDREDRIKARLDVPQYFETMSSTAYKAIAVSLISQDFPLIPINKIKNLLVVNGSSVLRTYTAIDETIRHWNDDRPAWKNKQSRSKQIQEYLPEHIHNFQAQDDNQRAAIAEFLVARRAKDEKDEEARNFERAKAAGEMGECGCCFEELPTNRMVKCSAGAAHLFCRPCMRQHAETTIGNQRYELTCMSMDGCSAGFSASQRSLFLDEKLQVGLDRIEQQAVLEMAGIENLETCPFCPFAMEYPPIKENREFRCLRPDCEIVSCRLCRRKSHLPKTCEEAAIEEGHSARHAVEEAITKAVVRNCNKCGNPYIKIEGCNKIVCTKCRTMQCYVCRKTITEYSHFDDTGRGGKHGQCPLYDSTEERHQNEAQRAEEEARKRVMEENPELDTRILDINMSDKVNNDERRRLQADPRAEIHHRVNEQRRAELNEPNPARAGLLEGLGAIPFEGPEPLVIERRLLNRIRPRRVRERIPAQEVVAEEGGPEALPAVPAPIQPQYAQALPQLGAGNPMKLGNALYPGPPPAFNRHNMPYAQMPQQPSLFHPFGPINDFNFGGVRPYPVQAQGMGLPVWGGRLETRGVNVRPHFPPFGPPMSNHGRMPVPNPPVPPVVGDRNAGP